MTEARLKCGLTVDEVRSIAGREVQGGVSRDWMTHIIRDGSTDLWLGFQDGKLRWSQGLWAQKMMKMAMYPRHDFAAASQTRTPDDAFMRTKLIACSSVIAVTRSLNIHTGSEFSQKCGESG